MNQRDFAERVASVLQTTGVTKRVPAQKKTFTITSQDGVSKQFVIMEPSIEVIYSVADVLRVIQAMIAVIHAALRIGENIRFSGFGRIMTAYRDEIVTKDPKTGSMRIIKAHYSPKIKFAKAMRQAANEYAKYLQEVNLNAEEIVRTTDEDYYYEEYEDEFDDDLTVEEETAEVEVFDIEEVDEEDDVDGEETSND